MRVPFSWLRDYVAWPGTVEELAELLTMSGTEVEGIDWVGAPRDAENLSRFVVGRVVTKEQHPNADKLSLCQVDVGAANGGVRQIVCGATNFAAGDTVAVSLTGAVLANGVKLKKASLRGVESDGMMMSEAELGYEASSPGIAVLPADWVVGLPLQTYLPVSEAVLELEITPNRPDCLSVYGVAREVAAVSGMPLAAPPTAAPATGGSAADEAIAVDVRDFALCPRYAASVIRGVTIADSPPWLKARLTHAGMRPINNVVDVSNYVMLAWGQPLHAFDAGKIEGARLIVRRAEAGEQIVTLDGVARTLSNEDLVIADVRRPLVIAGVFGSIDAEVDEHTTDLVLEAATFDGATIMRTESRTGIRSEASSRFEKGLDRELVPGGLAMAARLFAELCGGTVAPGVVDVRVAGADGPGPLRYRPAKCDALLGLAIPAADQAAILRHLACDVVADGAAVADDAAPAAVAPSELMVTPSTFRADLQREVDLIEEVGRVYGFARLPETLPLRRDAVGRLTKSQRLRRLVRDALAACGLDEAVTYAFIAAEQVAALDLAADDRRAQAIALANPMSAEQGVMRTLLLPGLLASAEANLARQNRAPNLFEQARVYLAPADERGFAGGAQGAPPADEVEHVAVVLCGPLLTENWLGSGRATDFFTMKGIVERLLVAVGVSGVTYESCAEPFVHPGKSADVYQGTTRLGWLGQVRPDVAARFGIAENDVYACELSLDALGELALPVVTFEDLVTYPPASQDLAVVVDVDVPAAAVVDLVRKAGGKLLRSVAIFDVYEGEQVPAGKRSLALRLVMRSPDRTLSEKDISGVRRRVLATLERELGATLR
jgi:phenylalanyl-tRNA synthetase beta chain